MRDNRIARFTRDCLPDRVIESALRGLLLYARFAHKVHARSRAARAAGGAPGQVLDSELVPDLVEADYEDCFEAKVSIPTGHTLVVEGLSAWTEARAEGNMWQRFEHAV